MSPVKEAVEDLKPFEKKLIIFLKRTSFYTTKKTKFPILNLETMENEINNIKVFDPTKKESFFYHPEVQEIELGQDYTFICKMMDKYDNKLIKVKENFESMKDNNWNGQTFFASIKDPKTGKYYSLFHYLEGTEIFEYSSL